MRFPVSFEQFKLASTRINLSIRKAKTLNELNKIQLQVMNVHKAKVEMNWIAESFYHVILKNVRDNFNNKLEELRIRSDERKNTIHGRITNAKTH